MPEPTSAGPDDTETTEAGAEPVTEAAGPPAAAFTGSARTGSGTYRCRYAGAMLLYPYLDIVGAQGIFATLTGGPARRYGDLSVLTCAPCASRWVSAPWRHQAPAPGRGRRCARPGGNPQLATLRARLSALADNTDPLALQRALAR